MNTQDKLRQSISMLNDGKTAFTHFTERGAKQYYILGKRNQPRLLIIKSESHIQSDTEKARAILKLWESLLDQSAPYHNLDMLVVPFNQHAVDKLLNTKNTMATEKESLQKMREANLAQEQKIKDLETRLAKLSKIEAKEAKRKEKAKLWVEVGRAAGACIFDKPTSEFVIEDDECTAVEHIRNLIQRSRSDLQSNKVTQLIKAYDAWRQVDEK